MHWLVIYQSFSSEAKLNNIEARSVSIHCSLQGWHSHGLAWASWQLARPFQAQWGCSKKEMRENDLLTHWGSREIEPLNRSRIQMSSKKIPLSHFFFVISLWF